MNKRAKRAIRMKVEQMAARVRPWIEIRTQPAFERGIFYGQDWAERHATERERQQVVGIRNVITHDAYAMDIEVIEENWPTLNLMLDWLHELGDDWRLPGQPNRWQLTALCHGFIDGAARTHERLLGSARPRPLTLGSR